MRDNFSLVLPAHNEEEILEENVEKLIQYLKEFSRKWELIIVEDGCSDDTPEIAQNLSQKHDKVKHLSYERKLGKGKAITEGFEQAKYPSLIFMDADLATDLKHIPEVLEKLKDHDIVIGSRYLERSKSERKFLRRVLSRFYNTGASKLLGTDIRDHQCGFKGFRKDVFRELKDEVDSNHWFWDTEILIRARKQEMDIKEIPVDWEEKNDSEVEISDAVIHFTRKIISEKVGE